MTRQLGRCAICGFLLLYFMRVVDEERTSNVASEDELGRFGSTVQWHHRRNVLSQPQGVPEFKAQAFTCMIFLGMRMRGL